jgi:antitoxin component YwqK of YwqJK toxin-antitoxin module
MKKLVLAIYLVIFAVAGCAKGGKEYTIGEDVFYDEELEIWHSDNKLVTGVLKWYYENGKIQVEFPVKNGKYEGLGKTYYESGKLKKEISLKNNKREGLVKRYYESGKLEREDSNKNGKKEGLAKVYYENGAVLEVQYKNDIAVSGFCVGVAGKRTPLTTPEITYWNNGDAVTCK